MKRTYYHYAIVAGLFASVASFFGKFTTIQARNETFYDWIPAVGCLIAMILCNVFVCTFFAKAMHQKGGSLVATVTSTATNYCLSAIIGSFVFGEISSAKWWFGTCLVLIGLLFITIDNNSAETETTTPNNLKKKKVF